MTMNSALDRTTLSDAKRALLEKRLRGERVTQTGIPRRLGNEPAALSFAQERLWFLHQLNPQTTAYNMHEAFRLRGHLDVAALERALNGVIARQSSLRTTFRSVNGHAQPVIAPVLCLTVTVNDLRGLPAAAQETEAQRLAVAEAQHHFDLNAGPLLRVTVIQQAEATHWLLLTMHHIISDEWSNGIFWRELSAVYAGAATLPELPIEYADFAHWQRDWLRGEVTGRQLAYWKGALAGELPLLQLPVDHPRPAAQSYRGAMLTRLLPPETLRALQTMAQQHDATVFMTLLAAYYALLHRYTGQSDLLVGTPIANRNRPEVEHLIGFCLNTLALRVEVTAELPVSALLARVRSAALGAYAHPDVPFEKLVDELQPQRDLSYNPLFQTMFVYQNQAAPALALPGLSAERVFVDGGVSKFDLTLFAVETERGLELGIEFATDLFEAATIERLLGHFEMLLAGIGANAQTPVGQLPLLTDSERQQLLVEWNSRSADYPRDALIHHFIEQHAEQTPDAPAIFFQNRKLTYRELNQRANQLAHHLQSLGVRPNTPVALCVERSLEMFVGMLGILKAGGAYVPLDPSYPMERLAFLLKDTQAPVVLTQNNVRANLPPTNATVLCLDSDVAQFSNSPISQPNTPATSDSLAYLIYTSGSTGQPKGVPITHRNLVHSTRARFDFYPGRAERYLLLSSFAFDSSVAGIFWALCQGGALCLPDQEGEKDVHHILSCLERWRVTHTLALPALYQVILEFAHRDQLSSLRCVIVAGEACTPPLVQRHYALAPQATLYNEYGPTEGTVWATAYQVPRQAQRTVAIGKPIANMQAYVLDAQLQPAPIGVAGELYIAGDGVSAGYWNRPDLTAERFVEWDGRQLYKTGDLVRHLSDGNLEFLGRVDHQIKLRGYRIELEEIETALTQHPAVHEAVVVAREVRALDESALLAALTALGETEALRVLDEIERDEMS